MPTMAKIQMHGESTTTSSSGAPTRPNPTNSTSMGLGSIGSPRVNLSAAVVTVVTLAILAALVWAVLP